MPNFELSDEEKQLSETARDFARKEIIPVAGQLDEDGTFPARDLQEGVGDRAHELRDPRGLRRPRAVAAWRTASSWRRSPTAAPASTPRWPPTCWARCRSSSPAPTSRRRSTSARLLAEPIFAAYCCSRARRRLRRRRHAHARREGGRRLRPQRPEALDHQRRRRQLLHRLRAPAIPRCSTRASPASSSTRHAGRQGRQEGEQDGAARVATPTTSSSRT